jgi:hypothetical protein
LFLAEFSTFLFPFFLPFSSCTQEEKELGDRGEEQEAIRSKNSEETSKVIFTSFLM